jgi:hypothetical protein
MDWAERNGIVRGSRVAVCGSRTASGRTVAMALVARTTKTLVILENDRRFYRRDGKEVGPHGVWDVPARLLAPDDPYVVDELAVMELRKLAKTLARCAEGNRERIQVLKALRTMRYEIQRTWDKLGGDDTGPLED